METYWTWDHIWWLNWIDIDENSRISGLIVISIVKCTKTKVVAYSISTWEGNGWRWCTTSTTRNVDLRTLHIELC